MAKLDLLLLVAFGTISVSAFGGAVWCLVKALNVAGEKDGDLKMFFWAVGMMLGFIISGVSAAYIVLPILFHN
ncbi:MAG: hypothetical protein HY708_07960 [Ignavibacteriae bacterium]|nr:hypothetical protein [Ignavibacteriota bacterium]